MLYLANPDAIKVATQPLLFVVRTQIVQQEVTMRRARFPKPMEIYEVGRPLFMDSAVHIQIQSAITHGNSWRTMCLQLDLYGSMGIWVLGLNLIHLESTFILILALLRP